MASPTSRQTTAQTIHTSHWSRQCQTTVLGLSCPGQKTRMKHQPPSIMVFGRFRSSIIHRCEEDLVLVTFSFESHRLLSLSISCCRKRTRKWTFRKNCRFVGFFIVTNAVFMVAFTPIMSADKHSCKTRFHVMFFLSSERTFEKCSPTVDSNVKITVSYNSITQQSNNENSPLISVIIKGFYIIFLLINC